jgi:phosphoribosylamine--glycine ligase
MKILFISNNLIGGNIAKLLLAEGHEVKIFIEEKGRKGNFDSILHKTNDWKKELSWVGKEGLIVFDDIGYGNIQSKLRKQGYKVFGGSQIGDKLESDREYAQKIFSEHGLKIKETKDFENIYDAIEYIQKNPRAWVIKQNGKASKSINYVGYFKDGRDVVSLLKNYAINSKISRGRITLQEKIEGVEIGVGRYFNGKDWVGPIEFNIEYKKFFPGDIGPTTSEMGTLAWYSNNEKNKLYKKVLAPLKPFLQKIDYRGDFEINCIVNKSGAFPLEATPRFGSPIIHLHSELHKSPWGEFLKAIAEGKKYNLKWKKGIGIVILLAVPPFPYHSHDKEKLFHGLNIFFDKITPSEANHLHFEEMSRDIENPNQYYISDDRGYVMYVTHINKNAKITQEKAYSIIKKIIIPKMIYRNDIGDKFIKEDYKKLKAWEYID